MPGLNGIAAVWIGQFFGLMCTGSFLLAAGFFY